MSTIPKNTPAERIIPVTKWPDFHDWPTVAGLRWLIFKRKENGLEDAGVIKRAGRRVLIDEASFFQWMKSTKPQRAASPGRW